MIPGRATRWAEVDLAAIRANVRALRARLRPETRLLVVVKADAYGHGARRVAPAALEAGADWLSVATVEEGLELRAAGIEVPVLVMGPATVESVEAGVRASLSLCAYDAGGIELAQAGARAAGGTAAIHLKVDTGMARLGAPPADAPRLARLIAASPLTRLEGLWTHLAEADDPASPRTGRQLDAFNEVAAALRDDGLAPLLHCSNSAAALLFPEAALDIVRCGLPVYGYPPSPAVDIDLAPALTWKARVVAMHELAAGDRVGYGGTFVARAPTTVATISAGYADGYRRALSGRGCVLVRGRRAPIVGRVSMDFITADVTGSGVEVGDEVVLLGAQGGERIGADDMAELIGTISWEVLCAIGPRVVRVPLAEDGDG